MSDFINIEQNDGFDEILIMVRGLEKKTKKAIRSAMLDMANLYVKSAKKMIRSEGKTGELYIIYRNGSKSVHRASAPYQSPANLDGMLANSVGYEIQGTSDLLFGYKKNTMPDKMSSAGKKNLTILKYGSVMEGLTIRDKPPLLPRPALRPAFSENIQTSRNIIQRRLGDAVKKK